MRKQLEPGTLVHLRLTRGGLSKVTDEVVFHCPHCGVVGIRNLRTYDELILRDDLVEETTNDQKI